LAIGSFASLSFRSGHALKIHCVLLAAVIAVAGNPEDDISTLRKVRLVMKDGVVYRQ